MSKKYIVYCLLVLVCTLVGCKKNQWADWKVQNEIWLQNNANQPGVRVTSSGLQYKIIADPTPQDAIVNQTSTIVCDYTVRLINGCIIESNSGAALSLSSCISGFAEGCHKVHAHGDVELYIPAYIGYDAAKFNTNDYYEAEGSGTEGTQSFIPPYSTLIYQVHICAVSE